MAFALQAKKRAQFLCKKLGKKLELNEFEQVCEHQGPWNFLWSPQAGIKSSILCAEQGSWHVIQDSLFLLGFTALA